VIYLKYILDIPSKIEAQIRAIVTKNEYGDLRHFVLTAIENQVAAESGDVNIWIESSHEIVEENVARTNNTAKSINPMIGVVTEIITLLPDPSKKEVVDGFLWGQYYKFLPLKLSLRVLANLSRDGLPTYDEFRKEATDSAIVFGELLVEYDAKNRHKHGEKLAASFPSGTEKSRNRFMNQYLIYIRPTDQMLSGMLPEMKFINLVHEDESYRVGLTESGYKFALIENPVIDTKNMNEMFSHEESQFLINHINMKLEYESKQIKALLKFIKDGNNSRNDLNDKMAEFYSEYQINEKEMTDATVNTMRAGLISRLQDIGLITKKKSGIYVKYILTERGENYE
jgi:hypothetical protein